MERHSLSFCVGASRDSEIAPTGASAAIICRPDKALAYVMKKPSFEEKTRFQIRSVVQIICHAHTKIKQKEDQSGIQVLRIGVNRKVYFAVRARLAGRELCYTVASFQRHLL